METLADHIESRGGSRLSPDEFRFPDFLSVSDPLPEPGLWTVKLVQGAVAAGAQSVSFKFHRTSIEFSVQGGKAVSATRLFLLMTGQETPADNAERHWQAALQSLCSLTPRSLAWSSQGQHLLLRGDSLKLSTADDGFALTVRFQLQRLLMIKRLAHDYKALCDHCRLCPIPLELDSRIISQVEPPSPTSGPAYAIWVVEAREGVPSFPLYLQLLDEPLNRDGIYIRSDESWITRRTSQDEGVVSCPLLICLGHCRARKGGGAVHWIVDGAIVKATTLPCEVEMLPLDIVCPAELDDLDSDGWTPRHPDTLLPRALISETLEALYETLKPYPLALESAVLTPEADGPLAQVDKVLFSCMFTLAAEGWRATTRETASGEEILAALKRVSEALR